MKCRLLGKGSPKMKKKTHRYDVNQRINIFLLWPLLINNKNISECSFNFYQKDWTTFGKLRMHDSLHCLRFLQPSTVVQPR